MSGTPPLAVTDSDDLALRLRFMRLEETQAEDLRRFWVIAQPAMPDVIDDFYTHMMSFPEMARVVGAQTDRLKAAQLRHWERLFSGRFDAGYLASVRAIGQVHHRIGLAPRWYMGAYNVILSRLNAIAIEAPGWTTAERSRVVAAIGSAVMLDMDVAISVYVDASIETEQARQRALSAEESRGQIARLLSGLPAAVYRARLAPDGSATRFQISEAVERVTGWPVSTFPDWGAWAGRIAALDGEQWRAHFAGLRQVREASIDYDFVHRDGTVRRFRDQSRILEEEAPDGPEVVGYVSDITRDHALRQQAIGSAKLATLGEMATGLAHEMNQPISIMSLAAENVSSVLQRRGAEGIGFALTRMDRIKEQAARARTIINHLRIFGRQGDDGRGPVQVDDAVRGAVALVGAALRASAVVIEDEITPGLPAVIGDLVLAEQVLVNLMLNARDAMEKMQAEAPRRLVLSAWADETAGTVVLSLADSGPGIPEAIRKRIFEPFFTTKEVGKGTGLGLSICHGIMTSFGGDIMIDDAPEGGARFLMTFRQYVAAP